MRIAQIIAKQTSAVTAAHLIALANSANHRYKTYKISKRNGQHRTIEHPSRQLKFVQRWLGRKLFSKFPIHSKAFAYVRGKSIAHHAEIHVSNNYLLRIDFKNFFPSITAENIKHKLNDFRYKDGSNLEPAEIDFITKIVTKSGQLTIGAPSSPIISNILMYEFDHYWDQYSSERGITYSRYADDIYFSTNVPNLLNQCLIDVREYLRENPNPRLFINDNKVVHTSKKRNRTVTGLTLTSDRKVSIGRDRKRQIRSLIFKHKNGLLNEQQIGQLSGILSYVRSVEPEFITSIEQKYGGAFINSISGVNQT
ncbi:MAG: RNA-directed DNA polymerase [Pseudomonadota bacterium]|nr:RNA-directed DNA polymerase [Pseudomonadota bacterium]QKK05615.1 MAG: RNA-directed DNA polymerase [Pseudomonadota bacterium]